MKYLSLLIFTVFLFFGQTLLAQKLVVDSFIEAQGDLSASAQATQRIDNNGDACALIKVYLPNSGAQFRGNLVGSTVFKVNQYWVYLTKGSKSLGIDMAGYFPLDIRFENYGISGVQSKTTYILLIMPDGNVQVVDSLAQKTVNVVAEQEPAQKEEQNLIKEEEQKEEPVIAQEPEKSAVEAAKPATFAPKQKSSASFLNPPTFYIGANYQLGSMQGISINAGMNIKKFNAEIDFVKGLGKSDPLFLEQASKSNSYTYNAISLSLHAGYGLLASERFRFIPQLGFNYAQVTGSPESNSSSGSSTNIDTYALGISLGLKVDFDIVRNFGISVCPEYAIPVSQGGIYKGLSDADSTVKGFASGFNLRAGIYVCF